MNKKSKKTLKDSFNIPEPNRKEQFFNSLEIRQQKKLPAHIPMYVSAVATAVLVIGVWGGVKNLPYFNPPEITDIPVYSKQTSMTESYKNTTTAVSAVTEKNTTIVSAVRTSTKTTSTEKVTRHSETVTTVTSETINTTTKENKTRHTEDSQEIKTTDDLSESTAENHNTTSTATEITSSARTTARTTTTRTTTKTTTCYTTVADTTIAVTTQDFEITTTPAPSTVTTTTKGNTGLFPITTIADEQDPPVIVTTTGQSGATNDIPIDYTVNPPVRYYPNDNVIDISDLIDNNFTPPPSNDGIQTEIENSLGNWVKQSDLIVIATVDEVIYTGIDGIPYTQENISVSEVIYGDIPQNSVISVYGIGGYIPVADYTEFELPDIEPDSMLFVPYNNKTTPEVGETCLYFLRKSNGKFPDGSYYLTSLTDTSKFRYNNGYYTNLNKNNLMFTIDELYEYLNN